MDTKVATTQIVSAIYHLRKERTYLSFTKNIPEAAPSAETSAPAVENTAVSE